MNDQTKDSPVNRLIEDARMFAAGRPAPDLAAGVLRRIQEQGLQYDDRRLTHRLRDLATSLWSPREVSLRLRPAYAVLGAVLLGFAMWIAPRPPGALMEMATGEPRILVQFRLELADAADVRLAGSFTNWQRQYELQLTAAGVWTVTVPLSPGVHDYMFVVDGHQWIPDPYTPRVSDGFGGTNSRLAVLMPEDQES